MSLKLSKNTVLIFLLVFYVTNDTLLFGTIDSSFMLRLPQIAQLLTIIIFFKYSKEFSRIDSSYSLLIILLAVIFSSWIVSSFADGIIEINFAGTIILLISTYCFTNKISFNMFIKKYDDILYFLSIISLLFFLTATFFTDIVRYLPIVQNVLEVQYYNGFFCVLDAQRLELPWGGFRNYGIFREPGVFQSYLIIGLLFQVCCLNNWKKIFVYVLTLLSTYSTTGYIALGLLIIFLWVHMDRNLIYKMVVLLFVIIVTLFAINYQSLFSAGFSHVFYKLRDFSFSPGYVSTARKGNIYRSASIVLCANIFVDHLIFGAGKTEVYNQIKSLSQEWYGISLRFPTDTFVYNFAKYGLIYGTIWLVSFYRLSKKLGKNTIERFIIFAIFMITLNTENYTYSFFIHTLFWLGVKSVSNMEKVAFPVGKGRVSRLTAKEEI